MGTGFGWLVAEVRLTLGAGTPPTGAADVSAVAVVLLALLRRLEFGDAANARVELSDLAMLEAERLVEADLPTLAALALLLPLLLLAPALTAFLPFLPWPSVPLPESMAALPLAASRLLTLSCSFCMISEWDRSVPMIGAEPRSE